MINASSILTVPLCLKGMFSCFLVKMSIHTVISLFILMLKNDSYSKSGLLPVIWAKSSSVILPTNITLLPEQDTYLSSVYLLPFISIIRLSGFSAMTLLAIASLSLRFVPAYPLCELDFFAVRYFKWDSSRMTHFSPLIRLSI